jgi:putative transposase
VAGTRTTKRRIRLTNKRNCKAFGELSRAVKHILHLATRRLIDHLVANRIGTLVVGYDKEWKQRVNIGRSNNQKFVAIPHAQAVQMLTYKAQLVGIEVMLQEERYTSKCSFLDDEFPQKMNQYAGRRVQRGLFKLVMVALSTLMSMARTTLMSKHSPRHSRGERVL